MSLFKIGIANKIIEIQTLHERTYSICSDFIVDGNPDFHVSITQQEIEYEKEKYVNEYGWCRYGDGHLEVFAVLRKVANCLIENDIFLFHGAAVGDSNGAYIFTGKSGIGKTTHIKKWLRNAPDVFVINGDKPLIISDEIPKACGSPWAGKESAYRNIIVPIKAIILMERCDDNFIEEISFSEAFPFLIQQSYVQDDSIKIKRRLQLLMNLNHKVSFYRFKCNNFKDDSFQVAYDALHK